MYRTFITTIAAASIALTAFGAAPAFAGERENARAIAAILGIAAVGALIHKNNKKDKHRAETHRPAPVYQEPVYKKPKTHTPKYAQPIHDTPRYQHPKPRPLPQRAHRKLLPKQCFRAFETYRGKVRMFGKRCLKRNFQFAHRLPRQCQYIFDTPRGDRRGYEARCLREHGYRLARG